MKRLKEVRKKARLSQNDLAKKLGVKQTTYSAWERGKTDISNDSLVKIAHFFGVTTDYLLGVNPESEWIFEKNIITCSCCNKKIETNINYDEEKERKSFFIRQHPYCEDCGAKMKRLDNSAQYGHWIVSKSNEDFTQLRCSCCESIVFAGYEFVKNVKHCTQCGAKMDTKHQE